MPRYYCDYCDVNLVRLARSGARRRRARCDNHFPSRGLPRHARRIRGKRRVDAPGRAQTHDSQAGRKQHNHGRRHQENVRQYFTQVITNMVQVRPLSATIGARPRPWPLAAAESLRRQCRCPFRSPPAPRSRSLAE
jgi:hypothetical protein